MSSVKEKTKSVPGGFLWSFTFNDDLSNQEYTVFTNHAQKTIFITNSEGHPVTGHVVYGTAIAIRDMWLKNGRLHREDGPADTWDDDGDYYLNGQKMTGQDFWASKLEEAQERLRREPSEETSTNMILIEQAAAAYTTEILLHPHGRLWGR